MEVRVRVRVKGGGMGEVWVGEGCVVTCISLSELFGLRKTLKRVEKILRVVVPCSRGGEGRGVEGS